MRFRRSGFLSIAFAIGLAAVSIGSWSDSSEGVMVVDHQGATSSALCNGEPCDAVARGFAAFVDRNAAGLHGNGRSCADCHMLTDRFQLSPKSVQLRWALLQQLRKFNPRADDPLFRPIDADDFRVNGNSANNFTTLRQEALVRIPTTLPVNMKLVDPTSLDPQTGLPIPGAGPHYLIDPETGAPYTYVDVWRMTPSINNVALTGPDNGSNVWPRGPNVAGGYQLDARVATLGEQAVGAFNRHAEVQFQPDQRLLDDIASFERTQFSSARVNALAAAIRNGVTPLPDPDPALTAGEQQGKAIFIRACAHCHGGPGQTTTAPEQSPPWPPGFIGRYFNINTACPRPVDNQQPPRYQFDACSPNLASKIRTYEIQLPNIVDSFTGQRFAGARGEPIYKPAGEAGPWFIYRTSSDPGRALLTGYVGGAQASRDDWQKLDINGLRGVAQTAPYFHNNSAPSLLKMLEHYIAFYQKAEADLRDAFAGPPFNGNPPLVPPEFSTDAIHFDRALKQEEVNPLIAYLKKL